MLREVRMLQLKHASIKWTDFGCTVFIGGKEIGAWPHPEMTDYHVVAARLGYQYDLLRYCREHELAHLLVEEWFHDRPSQVLAALAAGKMLSGKKAVYEESMAQQLQAFVRANQRPIVGGVDWDGLKARFLECVEALDAAWEQEQRRARMVA
jgi:hypothetical protein